MLTSQASAIAAPTPATTKPPIGTCTNELVNRHLQKRLRDPPNNDELDPDNDLCKLQRGLGVVDLASSDQNASGEVATGWGIPIAVNIALRMFRASGVLTVKSAERARDLCKG